MNEAWPIILRTVLVFMMMGVTLIVVIVVDLALERLFQNLFGVVSTHFIETFVFLFVLYDRYERWLCRVWVGRQAL